MNVVFLGATKGMGRALSRLMAERGDRLFLMGRNEAELAKSAADLQIRGGTEQCPGHTLCDLEQPEGFTSALDAAFSAFDRVDTVVITAALFAPQDVLESDAEFTARLLKVNFAHTVMLCEDLRKRLLAQGGGRLVVFSSVAGDRGRKPVILYGASKAGLSFYLEGLDHKFREQGLVTLCVKPGFVKTGMTEGMKSPPFAGEAEPVAREVLAAIDSGKPLLYTPSIWRLVMLAIRHLPRAVMRKINF